MPPKSKFTKEEVVKAALEITREQGIQGLTARALAARLGCSVKPIFGLFHSMEEVQQAVLQSAADRYAAFVAEDTASGRYPPYKASGMAYIRLAREEKELFKLLFMRDRSGETVAEDRASIRPQLAVLQQTMGLSEDDAYRFHLEMWIYVHGIATMLATSYLEWDMDFISRTLSDVYWGLQHRYRREEAPDGSH